MSLKDNDISVIVEKVESELLLPDYRFRLVGSEDNSEGDEMYRSFTEFLKENKDLILDTSEPHNLKDYTEGFMKGVALVRLWMDIVTGEG